MKVSNVTVNITTLNLMAIVFGKWGQKSNIAKKKLNNETAAIPSEMTLNKVACFKLSR